MRIKKNIIYIPISIGELTDKITILEIKSNRIDSKGKRKIILPELKSLLKKEKKIYFSNKDEKEKYLKLKKRLYKTNLELWIIEDKLREMESNKNYSIAFIHLARRVYLSNDKRSEIKNKINNLVNSKIMDIKQYKSY